MNTWRDFFIFGILFVSLYFEVFMLITYLGRRRIMRKRVITPAIAHPDMPSVTIIVPCYNEAATASKTIDSLLALDYPKDKLKILAVNDGSTDNTLEVLNTYRNNPQIEIVSKENGGKHTVLNLGIAQCTTEFVGCLDADSYAKPDALTRIIKRFENQDIMAVVPSLHVYKATTLIQKMQKTEYLIGTFIRSVLGELNAIYVTPGPFSIFRRSVFDKIGPYRHAHNTEDMEMAMRMQSHGLIIACAHDAVVYTSSPKTVRKLYKQRVRWTSGFLHNVKDYKHILLKKGRGHFGNFVVPLMVLSAVTIVFTVGLLLYNLAQYIYQNVIRFEALGFKMFEWRMLHFNWFFTGTSPIMFAGLAAIALVLVSIYFSTLLSHGNRPRLFDIACYLVLYSIVAPLWLLRSLANAALSIQTVWR